MREAWVPYFVDSSRVLVAPSSTSGDFVVKKFDCLVLLDREDYCTFGVTYEDGTDISRM